MFPERSFTALRMTISVPDAGYKNVTREHGAGSLVWGVCLCGLHFCNLQTEVWVVGGGGMGYIFVIHNKAVWLSWLGGGCVGYIFVTHKQLGGLLVVWVWVTKMGKMSYKLLLGMWKWQRHLTYLNH